MRAGSNCSVYQALSSEALGVLKLAITLARRRGHAQVTPLHVANTMLASSSGQLRKACLQSNSHPLQCKALELCFNVALNRLPASSSSPMLTPHHQNPPTISNALVAAFKRAQAHQRRGSIESQQQQQQPILSVKIELEQLVISILDDPSVSRVMKEAGFSSTQVKSNVEKSSNDNIHNKVGKPKSSNQARNEDLIALLIDNMMLRKSIVIIGECHDIVGSLMDKVDRGDEVLPRELKEMKFISFPLHSVENRSRDEVEKKLDELRSLVKNCAEKGAALYLGDLKWIAGFMVDINHRDIDDSNEFGRLRNVRYCPVEHVAIEVGRLVRGIGDSGNFWLLSIATFHTFMRCKNGNPSLETLWGMHPLTIPQGRLDLSLVTTDQREPKSKRSGHDPCNKWISSQGAVINDRGHEHQLIRTCCAECSSKFEAEARSLKNNNGAATLSTLPKWLQQYKEENQKLNIKDPMQVEDLIQKWSSYCGSFHKQSEERTINFSNSTSSISGFSCDRDQII